jgi:hypothetical protein
MSRKVNVLELIKKGEVLTVRVTGDVMRMRKIGAPDENLKLLSLIAEVEEAPPPKKKEPPVETSKKKK